MFLLCFWWHKQEKHVKICLHFALHWFPLRFTTNASSLYHSMYLLSSCHGLKLQLVWHDRLWLRSENVRLFIWEQKYRVCQKTTHDGLLAGQRDTDKAEHGVKEGPCTECVSQAWNRHLNPNTRGSHSIYKLEDTTAPPNTRFCLTFSSYFFVELVN